MSDSLSPNRYDVRGGAPSRANHIAEDLNRLGAAAIQNITVVGGAVRRIGNSVCIEVPQQKSESFPKPVVITNCTTGTPGVVKIKLSTGPGSTTAKTGAVEEYAWIGMDAFSTTGMALWGIPINEQVGSITCSWLILDMIPGAAHWAAPASGDLASTQDNPAAATLCDG